MLTLAKLLSAPPDERLDTLRRYAPHSTPAFMWYFSGKTPYGCQWEWAERLDDDTLLREADFEPRDHGKTELFAVQYPLRRICLDPDVRILVVKNTMKAALKTVDSIKTQLETNRKLRAFYAPWWLSLVGESDICNRDKGEGGQSMWQAGMIYVKRRRVSQDPTLEAVGTGSAVTGGHFDVILVDDLEEPSRQRTETAYLDQLEYFTGTILQLCEPWTKVVVTGTFKRAGGDVYELTRENTLYSTKVQSAILGIDGHPEIAQKDVLKHIAYEEVLDADGRMTGVRNVHVTDGGAAGRKIADGSAIRVLCPEKWSIERLIMDRAGAITPGMSSNTWRREKMNDLSAFKESVYKESWFTNLYDPEAFAPEIGEDGTVRLRFKAVFCFWDTAHTDKDARKAAASFSVGQAWGVGDDGYYLLPDYYREQVEYARLKRAIIAHTFRNRPNGVMVEKKDTGIAILSDLRGPQQLAGQTVLIPLIAFEPDADKTSRAQASTPAWENGLVRLPKGAPWLRGFVQRHVDFPESTWKDDVDVSGMALNYLTRLYPLKRLVTTSMEPRQPDEDAAPPVRSRGRGVQELARVSQGNGSASRVQSIPGRTRSGVGLQRMSRPRDDW